ncbi:MAG: hypothetical protein EBT03_09955, partial [Betaproteobacteria bacterium]|nr:hypothetical protein [Betaproteobacteria bacterium]
AVEVESKTGKMTEVKTDMSAEISDKIDVRKTTKVDLEDIKESFQYLLNFDSAVKNGLCLLDPHGEEVGMERFLIVPREFAEKLLVLGGFPD